MLTYEDHHELFTCFSQLKYRHNYINISHRENSWHCGSLVFPKFTFTQHLPRVRLTA